MPAPGQASFRWRDGERVVRFGEGALEDAPALLEEAGFSGYALLTTERGLAAAPGLAEGADAVLHVPGGGVPEAAAAVRGAVAGRPLVALGGGRVVDAAKAIAGADGLTCAAVPTTLSGAEMTAIHRMPAGVEGFSLVRPRLVVAVPELMASQPMPALAASAMNALGHAAEALYVAGRNPVASLAALRAAELIAAGLGPEQPRREALALGSLLAGYAVGSTGLGLHHVLCQTLVRVAGTPHAETNAVMLAHSLALVAAHAPTPLARLAGALGAERAEPAAAAERVRALAARAGATRLAELGVTEEVLPDVAAAAAERPQLRATPGSPGEAGLRELLRGAM